MTGIFVTHKHRGSGHSCEPDMLAGWRNNDDGTLPAFFLEIIIRMKPRCKSMKKIFSNRYPFKILNAIVLLVAILVIDLRFVVWVWDKSRSNNPMNPYSFLVPISVM